MENSCCTKQDELTFVWSTHLTMTTETHSCVKGRALENVMWAFTDDNLAFYISEDIAGWSEEKKNAIQNTD